MKLQTDGNFINDIERWHKAYINQIRALSYSKNTIELYDRSIRQFIEYSFQFQDEMSMKDIKSIYITNFLSYLEDEAKAKGRKPKNGLYLAKSTKVAYLKSIRGFFSFISDNNDELYTYDRYFRKIKIADSSRAEEKIVFLSEDEIKRLLNVLERDKKKGTPESYRNSLIIKVLLYAGLRISEALNLHLEDFVESEDESIYKIKIYGKGGKNQTVFLLKSLVDDELDYFRNIGIENKEFLIRARGGDKQWNRINAFSVVNNLYLKAGIYDKQGLHILRHTLAMRLTNRGVSPISIKRMLRHSNIASTTIYAKATEKNIIEIISEVAS